MPTRRTIDPQIIRRIREGAESNVWWAKELNCSKELIRQIRAGMLYRDLLMPTDAIGSPSCERCQHWRGPEAAEPCDLGHRDPLSDGPGFARICVTYRGGA